MEKISVSIRVRPIDKQEAAKSLWKINSNAITLCSASGAPSTSQVFVFDHVFGTEATTSDIYKATTQDIVTSAVKGFNGTVFAYGQTSSGKTFTMRGTQDVPGIIPLAIHDVFRNLEEAVDREFLLRMSYMEIYNEDIRDLLAPEQTKLQVHESLERGIFVAGLREEIVANPEQILQLMEFGEAHRHVGETNMNVHSSRSHAIFRMVIESRDRSQDDTVGFSCDAVRVSVLNLVDLAGSERVAKTGAEGARLKEGTHINKSLMVLGTVINKLSEGIQNQGGHVPYRDSKLTRILQPSLGGNARTAIICNITPAVVHVDESRGTLQFASRAIRVTNCAQVNEILTDAALLKRQKKEIEELRAKLKESHSEHSEDEILTLRNTLLKSECERERIALELQEEKKAHAERERMQAQKIENLSTLVLNSAAEDREFEKRSKKNARRETWCPQLTSGCIADKDVQATVKAERWMLQNRDGASSLPPPFESLLEEEEPSNDKDQEENHGASPQHRPICTMSGKDADIDCGAVPDRSARIHVADRKRKHISERPSDTFQEELIFLETAVQGDTFQGTNDIEVLPLASEMAKHKKILFEWSNLEGSRSCQSQRTDKLDIENTVDKEDKRGIECTIESQSTNSTIQQLTKELIEAKDEAERYKQQLTSALEELEHWKKEGQGCDSNCNGELNSLLESLKKENEELGAQLTDVYIQFEEEKAAWVAAHKLSGKDESRELSTLNVPDNTEQVKNVCELGLLKNKLVELQQEVDAAKIVARQVTSEREGKTSEIIAMQARMTELQAECLQERALREEKASEFIALQARMNELQAEYLEERALREEKASKFIALQAEYLEERALREEKASEFIALQARMNELQAEYLKERALREEKASEILAMQAMMKGLQAECVRERALRELESKELGKSKEEVSATRELLAHCRSEATKERWILKTDILKLQVCVDALAAKSEVFHGRLLEVRDELKDAYEELDSLKGLKEEQNNEAISSAEAFKTGMQIVSMSNVAQETFEKDKGEAARVICTNNKNMKEQWQVTSFNPAGRKSVCLEKMKPQQLDKENTVGFVNGLQNKLMEETRFSSGKLAHTMCIPMRNKVTKSSSTMGTAQGRSRPCVSALAVNAAACNRVTTEVTAAQSKSFVVYNTSGDPQTGVNPPKHFPGRSTIRSKANSMQ
ncbi:hypothetical protein GOP47_0012421 [Adiantum capillus-veneris]|uniref:Kinesin motor domain-containing protein n=1 Tax=Adiantum capillus-veneris TaxID=13818 RepID=A0A9D4UQN2_ADICA|nr:hypothetical protein GOP47_0012421 [Adiantum capillus-veneris]